MQHFSSPICDSILFWRKNNVSVQDLKQKLLLDVADTSVAIYLDTPQKPRFDFFYEIQIES